MARKVPSISQLVRGIVRTAPAPLTMDAIAAQLEAAAPGLSKDPRKSVKTFLTNNRHSSAFKLPDGRVGWKPHLMRGATHRYRFETEDLEAREMLLDDAVRDLLYPALFDHQKDDGSNELTLALEGGPVVAGKVSHVSGGQWQLELPAPFWEWLAARGIQPDDSLILTALDGEERRYAARVEPTADLDEQAVDARTEEVLRAADAYIERQRGSYTTWDVIAHLNATGAYSHPVPPEVFDEIWEGDDDLDLDALGLDMLPAGLMDIPEGFDLADAERRLLAMLASPTPPKLAPDDPLIPLLNKLAESMGLPGVGTGADGVLTLTGGDDEIHPPDLDPAYYPTGKRRKARPSQQGKRGPVKTYVLRVSHQEFPDAWREIEIAEDQNFEDLHLVIQQAFGWDDDHLYSFFTGRKPFDRRSEISAPWAEGTPHTHQVTIGSVDLKPKQRIFYLFDYGDQHIFDVQVRAVNPKAPKGAYPKVVGRHGKAPSQYMEEEWDDEVDEEE